MDASQSATGAIRSSFPGRDRSSSWEFSVHALGHNLVRSELLTLTLSRRVYRSKGNTPDWILEHFIVHFSAYSGPTPCGGGGLTVMTIEAQTKYQSKR